MPGTVELPIHPQLQMPGPLWEGNKHLSCLSCYYFGSLLQQLLVTHQVPPVFRQGSVTGCMTSACPFVSVGFSFLLYATGLLTATQQSGGQDKDLNRGSQVLWSWGTGFKFCPHPLWRAICSQ